MQGGTLYQAGSQVCGSRMGWKWEVGGRWWGLWGASLELSSILERK